jgi:hypothetical protein
MKLTGENGSTRGKTCPSATLSTTNPTWSDPGSNPCLRGGRPAANRLSHGAALPKYLPQRPILKQPTLRLCVLCGSQNKQQLLPYKTLRDWFL